MNQSLKINHELAEVVFKPLSNVKAARLRSAIRNALDECAEEEGIPAAWLHARTGKRHGRRYQTPGYYLSLYRLRAGLTQSQLAQKAGIFQHHVSEMEHNRRPVGKSMARRIATILDCDHRRFL